MRLKSQKVKNECPGIGCLPGNNKDGYCSIFLDTDWCRCHNALVYGDKKKKG